MRNLPALFLSIFFIGCSDFVEVDARFAVYNLTPDDGVLVINGLTVGGIIPGGKPVATEVRVPIPAPRSDGPTGPSVRDRTTTVTVAVYNLRTRMTSRPTSCRAGAKVVTSVTYEVFGRREYQVRCTTSW
jgi:hypothetical protein